LRKDTLSHAYELMKVEDPKKRRRLAEQVARGELTLAKLREKIDGRRTRVPRAEIVGPDDDTSDEDHATTVSVTATITTAAPAEAAAADDLWTATGTPRALSEDSLVNAKQQLADAVEGLVDVLRSGDLRQSIGSVDRANLAKYLTIVKLKLENTIALVRSDDPRE
jgi:hypothetical protein